jgi:hypothetical protein
MTPITYLKNIYDDIAHDRMSSLLRVILLCLIVGLGLGGYFIYHEVHTTPYVASKDNFQITFPGHAKPTVKSIAPQSDGTGGKEGGRIYSVVNNNKNGGGYTIYINYYSDKTISSLTPAHTESVIEADTEYMAEVEKATITSPKIIKFNNLIAAEAILTPTDKTHGSTRILTFVKGQDAYMILGTGLTEAQFDKFTASFQFLN